MGEKVIQAFWSQILWGFQKSHRIFHILSRSLSMGHFLLYSDFMKKNRFDMIQPHFRSFDMVNCQFLGQNILRMALTRVVHKFGMIKWLIGGKNFKISSFSSIFSKMWRKFRQSPLNDVTFEPNQEWLKNGTKNVTISLKLSLRCRKPHVHISFWSEEVWEQGSASNEKSLFY